MLIRTKLVVGAGLLAAISVALTVVILGGIAITEGGDALVQARKNQLISTRDITKSQLEDYLGNLRRQILTFSNNKMIINATRDFKVSFSDFKTAGSTTDIDTMRAKLLDYYNEEFAAEYARLNNDKKPSLDSLVNFLDDDSIALQYHYMAANPHPLGQKQRLDTPGDASIYSEQHALYHPAIRYYLEEFGFYDIFIVDSDTGDIIYSVFKEVDFTTSLMEGSYADTAIGQVFKAANAATDKNFFAISDLLFYFPSYDLPAAFMASPIFDDEKKIGVLIFQMPMDRMNSVMTYKGQWDKSGLGETGETYLVGADLKARSISRALVENPEYYWSLLKQQNLADEEIQAIKEKNTNIRLQTFDTPGTRAVTQGSTGFAQFKNVYGQRVLSAYTPVNFPGLDWYLLSEITEQEALKPAEILKLHIVSSAAVIVLLLVSVGLAVGTGLALSISNPIRRTVATLQDIAEGDGDLTQRLQEAKRKDEIGHLAFAFNRFCSKLQSIITNVNQATEEMKGSAQSMSTLTAAAQDGAADQRQQIEQVISSIAQMAGSIEDVADHAASARDAMEQARQAATEGSAEVAATTKVVSSVAQEVERAGGVILALEEDSAAIGSVIDVIRGIADQTNLLALNAAIEAARAGEQGRGFAVVADEVRTLASKTQQSTAEIHEIIERLQNGTREAVAAMKAGEERVRQSVTQAESANQALNVITKAVFEIAEINKQIASAAKEQSVASRHINNSAEAIGQVTQGVTEGAEKTNATSQQVDGLATDLKRLMGQFKV